MAQYSPELAALVDDRLTRLGLSSREASQRLGMDLSHAMLNDIRRLGRVPGIETLIRLAKALEMDPNEALRAAGKPAWLRYIAEEDPEEMERRQKRLESRVIRVRKPAAADGGTLAASGRRKVPCSNRVELQAQRRPAGSMIPRFDHRSLPCAA